MRNRKKTPKAPKPKHKTPAIRFDRNHQKKGLKKHEYEDIAISHFLVVEVVNKVLQGWSHEAVAADLKISEELVRKIADEDYKPTKHDAIHKSSIAEKLNHAATHRVL